MAGVLHWLNVEFWGPLWPNLAADVLSFTVAWVLAHKYLLRKWQEQEEAHLLRHREIQRVLTALHVRVGGIEMMKEKDNDNIRP